MTLKLAEYGLNVCAVEPNDAIRANGVRRTSAFETVQWFEGIGEHTDMEESKFDLVTFGSSFNVCNRQKALEEAKRILKDGGLFGEAIYVEGTVLYKILAEDFIDDWKSHGTVQRQSKNKFYAIIEEIRKVVEARGKKYIKVLYTTRIWMAQVKL